MFKKWVSLCHTQNLNDSHNNTNWSTIISLKCHYIWHNPTAPWCAFLILARFLQLSWQKLGSWIILAVELVILQVLFPWPKNNSPQCKFSAIWWIILKFPDCSNYLYLLYTVWELLCSRIIPHDRCVIPLPANSLMQSARHVTAYVYIHFWISMHEYNYDEPSSIE